MKIAGAVTPARLCTISPDVRIVVNYRNSAPNGNDSTGDSVSTGIVGNRIAGIPHPPSISFRVGETELTYAADLLASAIDEVGTRLLAANGPVVAHLTGFEAYSDDTVEALIRLENDWRLHFTVNNCAAPVPLFDAVLTAIGHGLPITTLQSLATMACRVAAATPGPTDVVAQSIANCLRKAGLRGMSKKAIQNLIAQFRGEWLNGGQSHEPLIPIRQILPEAPIPDGALIPPRFSVSAAGINAVGTEPGMPSAVNAVVLPVSRLRDRQSGCETVEIAWRTMQGWRKVRVPRTMISNRHSIVHLASFGIAANSSNATMLVNFFAAYLAVNEHLIPVTETSPQLGWQGAPGKGQFLLGNQLLTAVDGNEAPAIEFHGSDHGDEQFVDGFQCQGNYDLWRGAMEQLSVFPRAQVAILSMFAAPLLAIVSVANFFLSFAGATSSGKTTVMRLAASVFGNPDERRPGALVRKWDATPVAMERLAALFCDLCLLLDDTNSVRYPDAVARAIYAYSGGQTRGRGSVEGLRRSSGFHGILLTTGERPFCSFSSDGGTAARVLEIWGSPFGGTSPGLAVQLQNLTDIVLANYGHAGPRFIRFLIANRSQWEQWRDCYNGALQTLRASAQNSVGSRLAEYAAILMLAAKLAHEAGILPWDGSQAVYALWPELSAGQREYDRKHEALAQIYSWACANQASFYGRSGGGLGSAGLPTRSWLGRWDAGPSWASIAIFPHALDGQLTSLGHNPAEIIRLWNDAGWLEADQGRRQHKIRVDGSPVWCVSLKRAAIDTALDLSDASAASQGAQAPRRLPALRSQSGESGNVGGNTLSPPSS